MRSQAELLQGTNIPTDELSGYVFTAEDNDFLTVAEGFAFNEWSRVSQFLGISASAEAVPENYEKVVQQAGRWTKDYPTRELF